MKKLWIPLIIAIVLVGAYLVLGGAADARAKVASAALKAAGCPTTVEELDPAFSAGSESTAKVIEKAAAMLTDDDITTLKRWDTLGWRENPARVAAFIKDKSPVYELVIQASAMPPADFGMNIREGFAAKITTTLQQYAGFRTLLRLKARELAASGKPDSAIGVIVAATRLAHAFAEPVFIYHLVSMLRMDSVICCAAQVAPRAGTSAIEELVAELQRLDFKAAEHRALQAENVITCVGAEAGQMMAIEQMQGLTGFLVRVLKPARTYAAALFMETVRRQLEAMPKPWFEGRAQLARIDSLLPQKGLFGKLAGVYTPNVSLFYERSERMTAWRDIAVLGLKALVTKKQTGKLPATLADIAADAPVDRFSGKPYLYKLLPDGFVVYSVGPDGKDDNGLMPDDLAFRVKL